jgi:AraC-like DNA-binding protein
LRETRECPVSIRDIASEAAMSPFHFIRRFHAVFGATPHQFRIDARLDRAKTLLAALDISITDVCLEIGFTSLGSFSSLFAQRVGAPPSVYRRRVRSIVAVPELGSGALTPGCLTLMASAFAISEKHPRPLLGHANVEPPGMVPDVTRGTNANQAHEHHGRQPGQGPDVLHRGLRLREEARDSRRRVQVDHRHVPGRA